MRSLAALLLVVAGASQGQTAASVREQAERYRRGAEPAILRELAELVAIPNLASDRPNIERNARRLVEMMRARGIEAKLLETPGAPPAVYGDLPAPGARRTVVFYAHY